MVAKSASCVGFWMRVACCSDCAPLVVPVVKVDTPVLTVPVEVVVPVPRPLPALPPPPLPLLPMTVYSDGSGTQFDDNGKVPRLSSVTSERNSGSSTPVLSSAMFVLTACKYSNTLTCTDLIIHGKNMLAMFGLPAICEYQSVMYGVALFIAETNCHTRSTKV